MPMAHGCVSGMLEKLRGNILSVDSQPFCYSTRYSPSGPGALNGSSSLIAASIRSNEHMFAIISVSSGLMNGLSLNRSWLHDFLSAGCPVTRQFKVFSRQFKVFGGDFVNSPLC